MPVGIPPPEATCAACMKRKKYTTKRKMRDGSYREYDNFKYSDQHNGWLCKRCWGLLGAGLKTFERVPLGG